MVGWSSIVLVGFFIYLAYFIYRNLKVNVTGKAVLISGCDTGFGESLAKQLDKLGMRVFAGCLTKEGAQALSGQLSSRSCVIPLDITNEKRIAEALATVTDRLGSRGLYALVNNAGIGVGGAIDFTPVSVYAKLLDVNFLGLLRLTKAFLPLVKKCRGRIINMSSLAGRMPVMGGYSISKYAVECFSDMLRIEMAPFGIKVVILEPGFAKTPLLERALEDQEKRYLEAPDDIKQTYGPNWNKRFMGAVRKMMDGAMDPEQVIKTYIDSLTYRFPYARYTIGWEATLGCQIFANLPSFIVDALAKATVFVPPENIPSPAPDS